MPQKRVTAKRPSRVRDSDNPQRDEPDALMCTSGSVGAPGSGPWGDPGPWNRSDPNGARITETIGFHGLAAIYTTLVLYAWI